MPREVSEHSDILGDVRAALLRRGKAIRYKCSKMEISEEVPDGDGRRMAVEFSLLSARKPPRLSFHLWSDRWMRADARQISKQGWLWQWTAEGHVLPDIDAGHLAARIEDSLSHASSGDVEGLETCWRPLIVEKEAET